MSRRPIGLLCHRAGAHQEDRNQEMRSVTLKESNDAIVKRVKDISHDTFARDEAGSRARCCGGVAS